MLICGDAGIGRQASLRCLCQYWRVGSSPISRTSVKDIRFSNVLYFYIRQISKLLSSKTVTLESHEIFDFVVEETRFLGVKSMILRKRNLFRRLTKASPRCPSQYWRVGSSPISRTIKETSFVYQDKRGFFLLSGQNTGRIIEKRVLERSICYSEARFLHSAAKEYRNRWCTNRISLLCKQLLNVFRVWDLNRMFAKNPVQVMI